MDHLIYLQGDEDIMKQKSMDTLAAQMEDFFPVRDVDHLEFYVGNAKQSSYYLARAFGFKIVAYSGLETGNREKVSYVLVQKNMRFVVSGALSSENRIAEFVKTHGDGVKDVALLVDDVDKAYSEAVKRGAVAIAPPQELTDEDGTLKKAVIGTYGDTIHTLVERKNYKGAFMPGFQKVEFNIPFEESGLIAVDHVVGNVEKMEEWVSYYENVMGFKQMIHFDDDDISTEYSALMSKVMTNGSRIKFPINEPADGKRKSQIQEYLEFYNGAGVQHLALLTSDIVKTVEALRANGVEFLDTPDTYYDELTARVGKIDEEIDKLKELKILVDRDDEGYLLQIFTKPIVDRPTLFIEIIQRKGSRGFGEGNFKALFESIEREQERRGNL
ncbi:4-hydroxyphenylpyruvate dioxygenase [Bacillus cereus ATCC 10876]|jgi:4-hydroxyphenylpyruvate dioxygenase|nr:4-hydroxyphenylpyruvate dioxygenase [Bacillus cereus ATCC 10876]EEK64131.1 4-hydroxyphenylpyruvate dioxygenase [Bacillus cereus 172560W]EEK91461.1 4-hydroxyphenylpyruvate dioxygenase [Bacillus cereus m1550]EEK96825.1 4-hydroxyphenylpyruvate dioxygenase [Bacillus cereus BDRD-ST24]EEL13517.1 4-hydroxyphenylpyruvate dioxygenase [Bacillus cereus BDRD-Cer4]EEL30756.1 4-hydroxyphenylpyruvate dioxygenase [Bacillus cereus Rock1-15]EEL66985.1 4-hydroxyphenylpyruvate dioxygenase [Bacillus cereus F65